MNLSHKLSMLSAFVCGLIVCSLIWAIVEGAPCVSIVGDLVMIGVNAFMGYKNAITVKSEIQGEMMSRLSIFTGGKS